MREYLKHLREEKRITQKQMAIYLGINANYYSMIENGERQKDMSLLLANKLADTLDVSIDYIVTEEKKLARDIA